jgi:hypothetical protein
VGVSVAGTVGVGLGRLTAVGTGVAGGTAGSEGSVTGLATGEAVPDGDGVGVGVAPSRRVHPELSQVQVSAVTPPVAELAPKASPPKSTTSPVAPS